jgi:hypothetical protein
MPEVKRIRCGDCKELHGSFASVKDCGDRKYRRGIYAPDTARDYWETRAAEEAEYAEWEMMRSYETDGFI